MDIKYLLKIAKRNFYWFIIVPVLMAAITFFLVKNAADTYKSDTLIYTGIATGYNISIESSDILRTDYAAVSVTFDNLINIIESRQVQEEVGIRLLAEDILDDNVNIEGLDFDSTDVNNLIEELNYRKELYKGEVPILSFYDIDNKGGNVAKIYRLLHSDQSNKLLQELIINSESSKYSIKNLSTNLTAARKGNSDMIELSYASNDPNVAQKTLISILDVFSKKQMQIKETEALNVIKYFETSLENATEKLKVSEEKLKRFKEQNGVINFASQTDQVARQKELIQSEYDLELMTYRGAQKAKARLEAELKKKNNLPQYNNSMLKIKNQLSALNNKKALFEIYQRKDSIDILNAEISTLEAELQSIVVAQYSSTNTGNVSSAEVLTQWLQKTIEESESEARLKVYQQRLAQAAREYDTYAPLGSKLEQFQRQRDIHEKEYLQIINDLNQAKIKQNNVSMASSINVVDYPSKATIPEKDKKLLFVIISGIIGMLTVTTLIFIKVFFDNSIRTPQRAEKMLNLSVIGVLPIFKKRRKYYEHLINQILSKIKMLASHKENYGIMIFSILPKEGKTTLIEELNTRLSEEDKKRIKFFEHTPLVNGILHHEIIQNTSAQIIVIDANRELDEADYYQLQRISSIAVNSHIVLNRVRTYVLDSILGKFVN